MDLDLLQQLTDEEVILVLGPDLPGMSQPEATFRQKIEDGLGA